MDNSPSIEYKSNIKVTGRITVEPVDRVARGKGYDTVLIMGPTGAGKSTFIETLGLNKDHGISSNRLEGCTQTVSTYRVNNVTYADWLLYLVDSPGFADTKLSEMAIVSMLRKWLSENERGVFDRILYFTPITHVRLPGSQRKVLKIFQELTGVQSSKSVTIVTTMWDAISGEGITKRAEDTFNQLRDEIWKDFIEEGAQIVKFHNTQDSAFSILDRSLSEAAGHFFSLEDMVMNDTKFQKTSFGQKLYANLKDRIGNLENERCTLQSDLAHAETLEDPHLQLVLRPRLEEVENDLARFRKELHDFGASGDTDHLYTSRRGSPLPIERPNHHGPSGHTLQPPYLDRGERGRLFRVVRLLKCWGKTL